MVTEITKGGDVTITSKGEEGKRIQKENSWTSSIIMLIKKCVYYCNGKVELFICR